MSINSEIDETKNTPDLDSQNLSLQNISKQGATRAPRPIVIERPEKLTEVIKKIADDCDKKFYIKTTRSWMKLLADSLQIKQKIIDYLKNNQFKFYITPDTIPPLKVIIIGLPTSIKSKDIEKILKAEELVINKAVQMTSRKDKRILSLFLLHLPRDEHFQKNFKLKALFHFRVNIKVYRSPNRVMQCFKCQKFFHHANFCFLDPKSI